MVYDFCYYSFFGPVDYFRKVVGRGLSTGAIRGVGGQEMTQESGLKLGNRQVAKFIHGKGILLTPNLIKCIMLPYSFQIVLPNIVAINFLNLGILLVESAFPLLKVSAEGELKRRLKRVVCKGCGDDEGLAIFFYVFPLC